MNEKREITGFWWIPDDSTKRWSGTLTLESDETPCLKLIVPEGFWNLQERAAPKLICGHDESGAPITLLFPSSARGSSNFAISQPVFYAGYVIRGIALSGADELVVNALTLSMQYLHQWADWSGFEDIPMQPQGEVAIRYRTPDTLSFQIQDDLLLELFMSWGAQNSASRKSVHEETRINFKSKTGITLKQSKDLISAWRNLLHFAALTKVYPVSVFALKDGHGSTHEQVFHPQDIEIYSSINRGPVDARHTSDWWVFRFADLKMDFGNFFAKWLRFNQEYQEAFGCYFTTIYHSLPTEVALLCLTQALESFHATKFQSHKTGKFADKIRDLAQKFGPYVNNLIPNPEEFAETVRDNRNYYTHHNPEWLKRGRVLSGTPLFRLNEKLRLIFQTAVLTEIGVSADRFQRLQRQLASEIVDYV